MTLPRTLLRLGLLTTLLIAAALPATAAMRERRVEWTHGGRTFQGVLVHDDAGQERKPALLMVPNWMGVSDPAVEKARAVAGRDYVVLVADVYGADVRPKNPQEAGAAAKALRDDRPQLRARMAAALDVLRTEAPRAGADPSRIGVFGFCFGGTAALELARSGADVDAVVSLHGGLATPMPARPGAVQGSVLVLNGAADKAVSRAEVTAFQDEMTMAGADWQSVDFGGAVHCFAEADAGSDPASNCRYDARAAERAYRMMGDLFRARLATPATPAASR